MRILKLKKERTQIIMAFTCSPATVKGFFNWIKINSMKYFCSTTECIGQWTPRTPLLSHPMRSSSSESFQVRHPRNQSWTRPFWGKKSASFFPKSWQVHWLTTFTTSEISRPSAEGNYWWDKTTIGLLIDRLVNHYLDLISSRFLDIPSTTIKIIIGARW